MNIWRWLTGMEQTFDEIVSDLSGIVRRLEARAAGCDQCALDHEAKAFNHGLAATASRDESAKAKTVAAKIGALLS